MEKRNRIRTKAKSQIRQSINDATALLFLALSKMQSELVAPDYFPIKNKGKSPPGKARSPGSSLGGLNNTGVPLVLKRLKINNKEELFQISNYQYSNFNNNLIFKIMKKQILLLVLAFFAAVTAYGQAIIGSSPRGISATCVDDAMHPIAGKEYIYKASSNQTGNYTFWATKDFNFITTGGNTTTTNIGTRLLTTPVAPATTPDLLATSTNYATANALDNVKITWSDVVLSGTTASSPTFVAVNQDGTCNTNFKAWSITPIKAFTVDIRNINHTAPTGSSLDYGVTDVQCFDNINSATYNLVSSKVEYNYGTQILYFEVIATNFTSSWTPTFNLTGLGNGQTVVIVWDYNRTFNSGETGAPYAVTSGTQSANPVKTLLSSTSSGVSIYVRVTITNNTFEGIVATPITLSVDGINSVNEWDIENNTVVDAGPLCNAGSLNDKMDVAIQTLNPRPIITAVAPSTPFAPGNQTN